MPPRTDHGNCKLRNFKYFRLVAIACLCTDAFGLFTLAGASQHYRTTKPIPLLPPKSVERYSVLGTHGRGQTRLSCPQRLVDSVLISPDATTEYLSSVLRENHHLDLHDTEEPRQTNSSNAIRTVRSKREDAVVTRRCTKAIGDVYVHDALRTNHVAKVIVRNSRGNAQTVVDGLQYPQTRQKHNVTLHGSDTVEVHFDDGDIISTTLMRVVRRKIACKGSLFISIWQNATGSLRMSTSYDRWQPWSMPMIEVYNYLEISHAVDILMYSHERLLKGLNPLFRIGRGLLYENTQFAILSPGSYQMKVFPHNSALDHCTFLSSQSLVPQKVVTVMNGMYYLSLHGEDGSAMFPPRFALSPPIAIRNHIRPLANLSMVNAFRGHSVNLYIPHANINITIGYNQAVNLLLPLQGGDCYTLHSSSGEHFMDLVRNAVSPTDSVCFGVPDHTRRDSSLDCFLHCHDQKDFTPAPCHGEIFTYHALGGVQTRVDVVIFDEETANITDFEGLYQISSSLMPGSGDQSIVPSGNYQIKVFPAGSINNSKDFLMTVSITPPLRLSVASQTTYHMVLQGDINSTQFPPILRLHPQAIRPQDVCPSQFSCGNDKSPTPGHLPDGQLKSKADSLVTRSPASYIYVLLCVYGFAGLI